MKAEVGVVFGVACRQELVASDSLCGVSDPPHTLVTRGHVRGSTKQLPCSL